MSKVVVVGGGVIGCAVAERLTLDGHHVTLLERDQLGCRASGAAAGELSPQTAGSRADESAIHSLELFPELIARIEHDTTIDVEYRVQQGLRAALDEKEAVALRAGGGRWLDAQACRQAEPALSPDILGALLLEHAHLTPARFVRALAMAAASRGADIREGTPVIGFELASGEVRAVITASGEYEADWTVIAAGPWSKEVASTAGVEVDVRPQRGQLAALEPVSMVLRHSLFWSTGYLVPKADGTIIAGGTEEDSGFDDRPTVAGVATLLELARRLVPSLVAAMGPPNLIIATGHHRKGILLAPLAATQGAALIAGAR